MKFGSVIALFIALCLGKPDSTSFINTDVKITTVLNTHDAKQEIVIEAKASRGTDEYRFALPVDSLESLSLVSASKDGSDLMVEKGSTLG
jgi:hypothetical protein